MSVDIVWFGYGAGLVMVGWVCGMIAAVAFTTFSNRGMR